MKKILALLLALALFAGCAVAESTDTAAQDTILATANAGKDTISLAEAEADFDTTLDAYVAMYAQYGYEMDKYDVNLQETVATEVVYNAMCLKAALRYAADNGYVLTEERKAEITAEAQTAMDSMREYYETYLAYYGYAGEELNKIVEDELAAGGYTMETMQESGETADALQYIYDMHTADITVTAEEVRAAFDAKVEAAKSTYANVDAYIDAFLNGEDILYTPEGMRRIQVIYVPLGEEAAEAVEGGDPAALTGLAKANAVHDKLVAGEAFETVMVAYSEEGLSEAQMIAGYPVADSVISYGEEFLAAAMALQNIGDYSDVVTTAYGYFILNYAGDLEAGAVAFEAREAAETEAALAAKKDEAYGAAIDALIDAAQIEMLDLSPLYLVFVSETVEATVAYAAVEAETNLTDMPAGDAVAKLAAGATLDVLGKIGVDGEEYAFVAVPGADMKGYVHVSEMKEIDEAAALAADNAALATKVIVEGKKPTFTIAMNDGSLIYGELYPEIAPQSVGNFVSLAGQNFYDGLIFHRVIAGFMIQGGDPKGDGTGGPGYGIKGEFANNGVENPLSHTRGVLSMARSSAMDSAGSQFFIMHADSDYLDGDYAAFGLVLGGIETVDLIASQPTNSNDRPNTDQTMRTVYVETYGQTYEFSKLED